MQSKRRRHAQDQTPTRLVSGLAPQTTQQRSCRGTVSSRLSRELTSTTFQLVVLINGKPIASFTGSQAGIPFYNNSVLSTNIEIKATRNKDGAVFESKIYWAGKPPFPHIQLEGCKDDVFGIQISRSPSNCTPYMHQEAPPIFIIDKVDRTKATFTLASSYGVVTHIACTEED